MELLVVVALIVVMTALAFLNWRSGEGVLAIERAAAKISQDVRRATELALRAQQFSCASGTIAGYGLFFSNAAQTSYLLFADCNNNQRYDAALDSIVETISIEKQAQISSVTSGSFGLVAVPPDPAIFLKDSAGSSITSAQVTLSVVSGPSNTKVITINSKGVVTIQ
ncbi:MAG: hypothetical protein HYS52_01495 [Candidatus Wildermuthbacteria bacterium]|nr:hypothetical protein [Candidatus Wildermuthbacteria bacterium]